MSYEKECPDETAADDKLAEIKKDFYDAKFDYHTVRWLIAEVAKLRADNDGFDADADMALKTAVAQNDQLRERVAELEQLYNYGIAKEEAQFKDLDAAHYREDALNAELTRLRAERVADAKALAIYSPHAIEQARKDAAEAERARIAGEVYALGAWGGADPALVMSWTVKRKDIERICGPAPSPGTTTNAVESHEVDADWSGDPLLDARLAWLSMRSLARELRDVLAREFASHYECEDCWYSCPKSERFCQENESGVEDRCTCGKDEVDALLASPAVQALGDER